MTAIFYKPALKILLMTMLYINVGFTETILKIYFNKMATLC